MLVKLENAWQEANRNANRFERLEEYDSGLCLLVLEGDEPELPPPGDRIGVLHLELPLGLQKIEEALTAVKDPKTGKQSWPSLSPFWFKTVARAYMFPRPNAVCRVGRRGGKSSTLCRVAVYECLFGEHEVNAGDTGIFPIVSAERQQAQDRIKTIGDICKVLRAAGICPEYKPTKEGVDFPSLNRGIRVHTASAASVSGFTGIGGLADEMCLWRDKDGGYLGARAVELILEQWRPTMATNPNAILWLVSAPLSTLDVHHEMYEKGTNDDQLVFYAPTWVGNPTISEKRTRSLEPDEQSWQRQYAAIPTASQEDRFFPADKILASQKSREHERFARVVAGGDFAFRSDSSALVPVGVSHPDRKWSGIKVLSAHEWIPVKETLSPDTVIGEALDIAEAEHAEAISCDLHYFDTVQDKIKETDIELIQFPTSVEGISRVFVKTRVLMSQGLLDLSEAPKKLIDQLKRVTAQVSPHSKGAFLIRQPRGEGHGDLVSALVCAIYAASFELSGAEYAKAKRRFPRGEKEDDGALKWEPKED